MLRLDLCDFDVRLSYPLQFANTKGNCDLLEKVKLWWNNFVTYSTWGLTKNSLNTTNSMSDSKIKKPSYYTAKATNVRILTPQETTDVNKKLM